MLTHAQELTRTMSSEPTRAAGVLFGRGHVDIYEVLRRMGDVETQGFVDALIHTAPASELLMHPGQSWTIKGVAEGLNSVYGLLTCALLVLAGNHKYGSSTVKKRRYLRMSYLFGVILSVAVSVIASLLLLSGDIEENPGPDLDYNSVDATQELSEDDLIDVLEELLPIKSVYPALGRSLRLNTADLKFIQAANPDESDALSDTLTLWLQQKYNVERFGPPTWRKLVEAVNRKGGGNNPELAKKIAAEHPATAVPMSSQSSEETTSAMDVAVTGSDNHSCPSEQSSGLVLTLGATNQSLQVLDEAAATSEWVLKEEHLTVLLSYVEDFCHNWYSIGMGLGFIPPELDQIKAMPRLLMTAPRSYLIELLSQWVQWPTKKHPAKPTLAAFCSTLRNSAKLGSLAETVERGMNQAVQGCMLPDDERKEYKKYLRSLYAQLIPTETSPNQWPPPPTRAFFQLAMIKGKAVHRGKIDSDFVRQTIKGSVEDILREKCPIKLEDVFEVAPNQKLILFEGAPGSGKSTLSTHIVQECSQGRLYPQYELVILVRLRDPEVQKATCFSDLLPNRDEEMRRKAADAISSNDGQGVLFVLDGWDELPLQLRSNSIFYDMIFPANKKLHNCTIIVTSRPIASADLRKVASTRIEILGFPPATLEEYFKECLKSGSDVSVLLGKIKENPVVASYCSFPLIASILVHIFECQNELPTTQYGIFSELILTCIYRHYAERYGREDLSVDSFEQLPEEISSSLMYICEIAYEGVVDDKVTFSGLSTEKFDTLSLLNGAESMLMRGKKMYYTFLHLSVQEFLAAYHIAKLIDAEQVRILDKFFGQPRFIAVFRFYAAISKLQTPGISDVVAKVAKQCVTERYSHDNKAHLIALLGCLFESQNSDLCTAVASHLDSQLQLDGITFTPVDCLSVDFFLSNTTDVKVGLNNCSIRGGMISFLFKRGKTYNLQDLDLIGNKVCDDGAKAISSGMSTMVNLKKLSLSDNKICDEGAKHVARSMHNMPNLELLDLSYNEIGDDGISAISSALKKMDCLQKLDLSNNSISDEGAAAISSSLKTMVDLETLSLSRNEIGDDGAIAISSALKTMTILSSDEGSVVTTLHLETLDLSNNKVGDEGATAISSVLDKMTRLVTLDLSTNEVGDQGIIAIGSSLSTLSSLQTLSLSKNKFGDEGAIALSSSFSSMTRLQKLYMSVNKIGNDGARALCSAMKTMTDLQELDLLDNFDVTEEGIEAFKEAKESKEGYKPRILVGKLQIL